ncbi:hypothetical protein [Enterovibrio norvegicus]|uniref:hypothetical protein n=1 Tax=Enterovibrio norvegicus TaxID=188144 RepID=UPI000C85862F|nr:hypothetical protein [Enterovibrio norvegicus]PML79181.1 hypothetical protein BCT69_14445 [Enterovibrio norvegicus]
MKHWTLLALFFPALAFASANTQNTNVGDVYVDANGRTLYTFSKDISGMSKCNDGCVAKWPPLLADQANNALFSGEPDFSTIQRRDGSKQWTQNGQPLYRWIKDKKRGDISGAGIKGVWPLARADDVSLKLYNAGKTRFIVNENNYTLYAFDKDMGGKSACYGECAVKWPPAFVPSTLTSKGIDSLSFTGNFGVTERKDGKYQWTHNNKPLYLWFKDKAPGDTTGNGVKNVWHIVQQ